MISIQPWFRLKMKYLDQPKLKYLDQMRAWKMQENTSSLNCPKADSSHWSCVKPAMRTSDKLPVN